MKRRRPASRGSWRPSRCGLFIMIVLPTLHCSAMHTACTGIAWADNLARAHPGPAQNVALGAHEIDHAVAVLLYPAAPARRS
ncbi:hypothetical protein BJ912DRAFT_90143 [Pholiota molesta]|nr:hypothetical protein BJ912DRAFT_90143 [Pholiota molesta]